MREAELLGEPAERLSALHRVEVLTLNVFDDRPLHLRLVVELADEHRHLLEADALRRAPPPFTDDDLEPPAHTWSDDDRLHEPRRADRCGERVERPFVESLPR